MKKALLALAVTSVLAACSSTPTEETSAPVAQKTAAPVAVVPAQPMAKEPVTVSLYPAKGVGGALGQRTIHYAFDKYTVTDEFMPVVDAHGDFLLSHGDAKVTLQGNCDERGSREYNLGLGQRRADSVRKILMAKGVKDSQIETVSFGKEKPVNPGHNAAAWAENRRTDIVYQGE
ncbi:peptidoglycan-associated lipoprotein Pal [Ferrovum myxofaciens]|jgi:peptidoglycan-associated lipoprotein|uniref:Peptidoglycan-associated lipoprotein n=2 Tax=root TaxID=1 RepID=A0A859AAF0_9PROT|nr:peptidoglycan-associated lipoprotein Pal [Ferrovum myxofaciens]KXW58218.1 outer membrane protein P6 precursor [Ferrovum myxofaciens]MBU6995204.1 peptidoglycan-associated lipoprotein Pal [Ferrovum myxofaciens]QKE39023.1 MAG: peptidoglycan-associated lipoprotein Pal [Ferrovum myxofaciens]QKE41574.1 MAG: peptidoglycan-associated lipoprotein Pal [Ferrovum myxofaciens]QWY74251.1 MAG: peptidoglycan-associated lipoprotein Pal [Ferrovum myxofaciens]